MTATRSLSFKLYPSPAQEAALWRKHLLLKDLWNAALEERIGAWRRSETRITRSDQEKALKEIRMGLEGWRGLVHTHEAQIVLKRLDLAFQAFFRRLRAGGAPGFPRFKSAARFRGWGYKQHGNGFRVEMRDGGRHGHATLFGIGRMRMRGVARTPGRVLKADVTRTVHGWMLNVVVETGCAERAPAEGPAAGLDWGVSTFATLAHEDGTFEEVPNPRHLDLEAESLKAEQRRLSAAARARKISRRALQKHRRDLARRHAKIAARRKDFLHKTSARIAGRHRLIATEALAVRNMTGSVRGTAEAPGRNVAQKAGLNRSILDTAPAGFLNMLRYKAEEAGAEFLEAKTRELKPSQRCPDCGALRKKTLAERRHDCDCGCHLGRDEAAALVLLRWGLAQSRHRQNAETINPAGTVGDQAAA
ncbi:putative transposase [Thioclava sp. ES.031]|uniref:RNA-guided endonuclease InsQ/TnpB family protein n=1 Tax=Thioclava sp. ES.031 TaxID=1798203 RepID=UPI000BF3DBDB|nr:RNA-guided endonuclease TnpB family protein [Thioclava sp. ES.031]PFG62034.1 putative transposase [Thioclava sp. ES.031]